MKFKDMAELIGKIVTVKKKLHRHMDDKGNTTWCPISCPPFAGWVTGCVYRYEGTYHHAWTSSSLDGYESEPPYFENKKRITCLEVKRWPNLKPVLVPLDGFEFGGIPEYPSYKWTEEDKENLRQVIREVPRDKRGRFAKEKE